MKRTLPVMFVATLAASTVTVVAQEGRLAAPQPRFSEGAITRSVSAAQPGRLMSQSVAASGADTNRSWNTLVGTVTTGRRIVVTLVNSTSVEGTLAAIDAHSISIEQPGGPRAIEVADVLRVRYAGVRKRHVIYGMLIGMAGGAVATVIVDKQSSHPSSTVEAAGLGAIFLGLPIGAVGGALVPIGPPLYEAANAVRKTP